jgi:exopolysaccharide biosynthesis polyprenyl glycosylphosphotransferase
MIETPRVVAQPAAPTPAAPRSRLSSRLVRAVYVASLVLGDVVAISVAFVFAYDLSAITERRPDQVTSLGEYLPTLAFLVVSLVVTFALMRLYLPRRGASHIDQLGALFIAVTVGNVVAMAISAFSLRGLDVPRQILVYAWALSIVFVWLTRTLVEFALRVARRAGLDGARLLIIGAGEEGATILHKVRSNPELGYEVVGFVDDTRTEAPLPVFGGISVLPEVVAHQGVGEVVVADQRLTHSQILDIVAICDRARVGVKIFPDLFHLAVKEVSPSEFGGLPMLAVRDVSLRGWNLRLKRAMDVVLAILLLVLFAPLMMAVALAIKLTSPGPILFVQDRVGIDGRPFPCVKFRSMRVEAEQSTGPVWATVDDDRTTPIGRFIRRFSIDELPQLVNVLVGDMSLVGPRPERPFFVEQFSRLIPRYDKRHREKAGVTGWAQVNGLRGQSSIEERTLYDLFYVEHWSPAFDLKILLKTIAAVIRGRNAY